jgi:GT2 family glycosyltransferase
MNKEPLVNFIVLNWNGADDTIECLKSLKKLKYKNFHILLADNGSKNNDLQKLEKAIANNPKVTLIKNGRNLGFAGGCNVALRKSLSSSAKYSLLLNNDTIVEENFLYALVVAAGKNKNNAVSGPKVYYYDEPDKAWTTAINFNYYFPPLSSMTDSKSVMEVNDIVGCAMLIRNDVLRKVGLFDEEYFAYGEESDLNYRILANGYKLIYCPESLVWHKISSSTGGGFNPTVAYFKMRNKIKFAKKNYPLKYWPTYFVFLVLYFIKEQVTALLSRNLKVSRALIKGVIDA